MKETDIAMHEGMFRPEYCPRKRADCEALSQIIASEHLSFICCGENKTREIPQDKYRVCFKNDTIDEMYDYDKRDLVHTSSVLLAALAVIEEWDWEAFHKDNSDPVRVRK